MKKNIEINKKNWHDCSFENLILDEDVNISLLDDKNKIYHIICKKCIGIVSLGMWDEGIIKEIKVIKNSDLSKKVLKTIEKNYKDSFDEEWYELSIEFLDKNKIQIICFEIEMA